jgi:hypothetical protein
MYGKPEGLWVTPEKGGNPNWKECCEENGFSSENDYLKYMHEVVINKHKVLHLTCMKNLLQFDKEYAASIDGLSDHFTKRYSTINWRKVAKDYSGILIYPYIWEARLAISWYYLWDCASGCIWKADAIEEIRLRQQEDA